MGYLGESIPKLGFGLMRLPMNGDKIDIEHTKRMVDMFLEAGFTYFDTAYGYNNGESEAAIKLALVDRCPRESYQLATKLPAFDADTADKARQMFYTSLERTGAGYFDFYLLHNLSEKRAHYFEDYGIWDFAEELKAKGLIKHYGFSFHDKADLLDEILNKHPEAEFVQLQINYADWDSDTVQSRRCYETARRHNKPVIIMEPVKGGSLANLPEPVASVFKAADPKASLASWALRFAMSLDGLVTVLSGMSSVEQMQDNLDMMKAFRPLDDADRKVIAEATKALQAMPAIPCTGCKYCVKDCPQSIAIPGIFSSMNDYLVYNNISAAKGNYAWETRSSGKASDCIACGQCESVCPQSIGIIDALKKAAELLEKHENQAR